MVIVGDKAGMGKEMVGIDGLAAVVLDFKKSKHD